MNKLFVISGPSGVGKGTVVKRFLDRNKRFGLSVSCTTRPRRAGEIDGVNYHFLSREEFETATANDEFLEWAEFAGNLYGTRLKNLNSDNLILEIDTQGALQVKEKLGANAVLIFIYPPSAQELETRLRSRGTEDETAIQRRLDFAKKELEQANQFNFQIINDSVENAVAQLEEIISPLHAGES